MTTRRPRGRKTFRRSPRGLIWMTTNVNETVSGASDLQNTNLSSIMAGVDKRGRTLVRTIVELAAVALTAGSGQQLALAIVLMATEAVAAAAFPEPRTTSDRVNWVWREFRNVHTSSVNDASQATQISRDLKSKRRMPDEDFDLMLILEIDSAVNSAINVDGSIRTLWMERP